MNYSFSIIVCSIKPELAEALHQNIASTIGCPFEMLICDNRNTGKGICAVYNEAAARATGDYLCFVHEDVLFHTPHWGTRIAQKLREESCGVIGFAGSNTKLASLSGWSANSSDVRQHYTQRLRSGKRRHFSTNPANEEFSPSVCLDGFCLFVRREVWQQSPFDASTFPGFHGYDLDFTTSIACRWSNYVCQIVEVEHISEGGFSKVWFEALKRYHDKHHEELPLFAGWSPTPEQLATLERKSEAYFIKFLLKMGLYERGEGVKAIFRHIGKYPLHASSWALLLKGLKYGLR